ncbi:MAG: hypothetical protein Q9179_007548 [Wetmoreana sp. 5 TL-2023]
MLPIHQLSIGDAFEGLTDKEKLYAHHMAKAAWSGTRIILRQVSPEANRIFDLVMELHRSCQQSFDGRWDDLGRAYGVPVEEVKAFLDYAAVFLSNGSGDQKFRPGMRQESLKAICQSSSRATSLFTSIAIPIFSSQPSSLGYPTDETQSAYYPGTFPITPEEIAEVSHIMEDNGILPENTRIEKVAEGGSTVYNVLQASVETASSDRSFHSPKLAGPVKIVQGDHGDELASLCNSLERASQYAATSTQQAFLKQYQQSFQTGDLKLYKESQKTWVKDIAPVIESIFGFVEPYRDPFGIRAEFEGVVAIADREGTKVLTRLVEESSKFIKLLPWAKGCSDHDGKGPFERSLFEPPDFSSIHALVYCSSIIFAGINLPNYNDIRQECGFKNVIIANRMSAESNKADISPFVDPSEAQTFQEHKYPAYYIWVVLHELLGHGTGKLMSEEGGNFNFDVENPPINPLTGVPIDSWYRHGQTWTGVFADLATSVDECRAELVGAYLIDEPEILDLFGFNERSDITAADLTYNTYLQLGVDGLRGLQNFNIEGKKWGQAHSRAHFAMLKCLLRDGNGVLAIDCDSSTDQLRVHVDRSRIITSGKPALGRMLLNLHMYRCTADVKRCREYYEDLSNVDGQYLEWRRIVLAKKQPKWVFVQANTFLEGKSVTLKEYPATPEGVLQSWAERVL